MTKLDKEVRDLEWNALYNFFNGSPRTVREQVVGLASANGCSIMHARRIIVASIAGQVADSSRVSVDAYMQKCSPEEARLLVEGAFDQEGK